MKTKTSVLEFIIRYRIIGFLLIVIPFIIWEFFSSNRVGGLKIWVYFVPPSRTFMALYKLILSGDWTRHVGFSLYRFFIGLGLGTLVGVFAGLIIGWSRSLSRLLEPVVDILRPFPRIALFPVFIVFLGIGLVSQITIIAFGVFFIMCYNSMYGARSVDRLLVYSMRTMGANSRQIFSKAVLPSALPYIAAGLRVAIAAALTYLIFAEMMSGNTGLGWMIEFSRKAFRYPTMFAGVMSMAVVGGIIVYAYTRIERRILGWHYEMTERA